MTGAPADLRLSLADIGLGAQHPDGSLPAGHNGPHREPATPVRNTGYWVPIFLAAAERSDRPTYRRAAARAYGYLLDACAQRRDGGVRHRDIPGKDGCNGLVGQGWTIEALARGAAPLGCDDGMEEAARLFLDHPLCGRTDVWHRLDVGGRPLRPIAAINQQIWFAAAGALVDRSRFEEVHHRVRRFLDGLHRHYRVDRHGVVKHLLPGLHTEPQRQAARPIRRARRTVYNRLERERSEGYQLFNLLGLAVLHDAFPTHPFWDDRRFRQSLAWVADPFRPQRLAANRYAYGYNAPGFAAPVVLDRFRSLVGDGAGDVARSYLAEQMTRTHDACTGMFSSGTDDPWTLTGRFSELLRLPGGELDALLTPVPAVTDPAAGTRRRARHGVA